jgi:hypothetical protein
VSSRRLAGDGPSAKRTTEGKINRDPGILNQRNVARRLAGGARGRAAHHSGGANRRTQGWAGRPRARRRSPPRPRWIDQFTAGPRGDVCPRRAEFDGLPKTAACSPPGRVMGVSPAGNRPTFSERSQRPASSPSVQRMSRHNPDTGRIVCFGRRTTVAHPGSTPTPASPEMDVTDAHRRDRGKVHES